MQSGGICFSLLISQGRTRGLKKPTHILADSSALQLVTAFHLIWGVGVAVLHGMYGRNVSAA